MTVMSGRVLSVEQVRAGVDVLEAADAGDSLIVGRDAIDLATSGGSLVLPSGALIGFTAVDYDSDVVTLTDPLPESLAVDDRLILEPRRSYTVAVVELAGGGEVVPVRVPHTMQQALPVGVRDVLAAPEVVDVETREDGSFWVRDVLNRPALEVWGDPDGNAAEMRETGLSFYTLGPNGRYEATRLGSGEDRLGVFNAEGQIVGGVTADGRVVGQSGAIAGDFSVGGTPLLGRLWDNSPGAPAGWLERLSAGAVARRKFGEVMPSPTTSFPTGEEWGYAKLGVTARAGRTYRVTVIMQVQPVAAGGAARTRVRYTTDGSEPTISSPRLTWVTTHSPYAASTLMTTTLVGSTAFTVDTDLRLMCSVQGLGGLEPRVTEAEFIVEDVGPQGTYGGGTYTTGRETTPPPTVREYTSTWTCSGYGVFDETGQPMVGEPVRQWSWTDGARVHTALSFTAGATTGEHVGQTIDDATAGATLIKAEVFLANTSWFGLDSGTAALGKGGFTDVPPTLPNPQATVEAHDWPTGAGRWVEVPTSWFSDTNRVVTLGDADGGVMGGWFMGPGDDFPPQARLTYTR